MLSDRMAKAIIVLVTTIWTANFVAVFVIEGYQGDQAINAIFMAIVGGTFALRAKGSGHRDEDGSKHGRR